jgi:hypothetical protein
LHAVLCRQSKRKKTGDCDVRRLIILEKILFRFQKTSVPLSAALQSGLDMNAAASKKTGEIFLDLSSNKKPGNGNEAKRIVTL